MDTEAPVDAWYTWVGVAVVGVAVLGFVLGLPGQPPPDATKAANTIDRVAGSVQESAATYEHDAAAVNIDTRRIAMRNDGGTTRASVAFGSLTPVSAVEDAAIRDALERITHGQPPGAVLSEYRFDSTALRTATERTRERIDSNGTAWQPADGVLTVRRVHIDGESLVLVDA
ncbi:hypothetical protein HLRTI_001011 [Halorhabdus tiamatea SARL4B]|uniref:Uncharacterized protein n=1 Tax=Halorhabdus tiamatea SARL4B TaxID=1033806 RepID=F7PHT9_9EURY|nr:hypothetical protein [Halorhabdus tiamatea]ERJ06933.1 hypothetical protein HLRTI_001011 [Halorhabdus tiamatea SARL4B]CCQ32365.1 conserved hypothetical protein [Halorhabdus tiamatea SARL4B]